jgi:hypothetical protein
MASIGKRRGLGHWLADFFAALVLFWAVALTFGGSHNEAHAISLPTLAREAIATDGTLIQSTAIRADRPSQFAPKAQTSPEQARVLLSIAFAAIVAINLGFWRHLRRVYASPRRSVWRRD